MNKLNRSLLDITQSSLVGLAVGDALGVPVEFMCRQDVRKVNLTEMIGKDTPITFESRWGDLIPAGAWSDDTSMTIASMESMISQGGDIDYDDVMTHFLNWWKNGAYCSLNFPFGLGSTVSRAMDNYRLEYPVTECGPKGMWDNGNGALMRILPFSLYCIFRGRDTEKMVGIINTATAITHGHPISQMGSLIFTVFLKELMIADSVSTAWERTRRFNFSSYYDSVALDAYKMLLLDESLLLTDIAAAVMSVTTTVVFAIKGTNPLIAFVELFGIPGTILVIANIRTLQICKKKREELYAKLETQRERKYNLNIRPRLLACFSRIHTPLVRILTQSSK